MYRAEIDGLRAVAVLLVTLFHLDIQRLAGGYVGVDVFFVISGYLITRNILKDGARFSFRSFYWRRARRLMPAVWTTTAATLLVSAVLMRPDDLAGTARSAIASMLSLSNVYFWLQTGYWDSSAALKPLLHTWSLAVEEQFYLFWPMLLVLLARRRSAMTAAFVALVVVGTAMSVWTTNHSPSAAFYLMPFRVMEFAVGALIAANEGRIVLARKARTALPLIGVAMIVAASLAFDGKTRFPGLAFLLPCIGAALVIVGSGEGRLAALALKNPPMVYIGRISYSLYLVHWPVVSLYKYTTLAEVEPLTQASLFAAMLVLAVLLHHAVEKPFRYGEPPRPALAFSLVALFTLALPVSLAWRPAGSASAAQSGLERALAVSREQFLTERQRYGCAIDKPECSGTVPGKLNVLVIGDSHGIDGHTVMRTVFPDAHTIPGERAGCNSFIGVDRWYVKQKAPDDEDRRRCEWNARRIFDNRPLLQAVDAIVFSFWPTGAIPELLDETLAYLSEATRAKVVIITDPPLFTEELPRIVRVHHLSPGDSVPKEYMAATWGIEDRVRAIAAKHGALYVSKSAHLCPGGACQPLVGGGTRLLSYDNNHLSLEAAEQLGRAIAPQVRRFVAGS